MPISPSLFLPNAHTKAFLSRPALIKNQWEHHWVFWVGPLLGGALGGGLYKLVFFNKKDDDY